MLIALGLVFLELYGTSPSDSFGVRVCVEDGAPNPNTTDMIRIVYEQSSLDQAIKPLDDRMRKTRVTCV